MKDYAAELLKEVEKKKLKARRAAIRAALPTEWWKEHQRRFEERLVYGKEKKRTTVR